MKTNINWFFKEILAFGIAAILLAILFFSFSFFVSKSNLSQTKTISGSISSIRGTQANFESNKNGELNFVSSVQRLNQITILGSSEMNDSPYASYHFLPDSLGIPAMGFGHAFHQTFAMFCELLACEQKLENSKICILLSPGWFVTEGTNTEAFVEFVPQNFIQNILNNQQTSNEEKDAVGKYISQHKEDFTSLTKPMAELSSNAEKREQAFSISLTIKKWLSKGYGDALQNTRNIKYLTKENTLDIKKNRAIDSNFKALETLAIRKSKNNNMFVDSNYFKVNLLDENGKIRPGIIADVNMENNQEFEDFLLLLNLLKSRHANACFVIQTLNPHYYENMEAYDELVQNLCKELDKAGMPYLNMYNKDKSQYVPGTLNDVMHLGDLGWMQINRFLLKTYGL